jgi:hypothetical protein
MSRERADVAAFGMGDLKVRIKKFHQHHKPRESTLTVTQHLQVCMIVVGGCLTNQKKEACGQLVTGCCKTMETLDC